MLHWKWLLEVFIKQNNECHESKCLPEILVEAQARQVAAKCQGWRVLTVLAFRLMKKAGDLLRIYCKLLVFTKTLG